MNEKIELVIGVVLYNNPFAQLTKLFKTIHAAACVSGLSYQIIAWNNGDEPLLTEEMKVNLLNQKGINLGFGKAHNHLMEFSFSETTQASYYLCINPDGLLHVRAIAELIEMAQSFDNKALIEAAQVPVEHPKVYDPMRFDTAWISGACFLLSKEIYKVVGGFDDAMFMYCEDVDLSWRVKKNGFMLKFCPRAWFYHDTSDRRSDLIKSKMLFLSARYLATKWSMLEFRTWVETQMVNQGMYPTPFYMPPLDNLKEIYPLDTTIVEGRQAFHFSLARW